MLVDQMSANPRRSGGGYFQGATTGANSNKRSLAIALSHAGAESANGDDAFSQF